MRVTRPVLWEGDTTTSTLRDCWQHLIRREHPPSVGENLTHESEVQVHDRVMISLAHAILL